MKKYLYLAASIMLAACSTNNNTIIEVTNILDIDRSRELVEVKIDNTEVLGNLIDENGIVVPYQVTENGLVFLADVSANSSMKYSFVASEERVECPKFVDAFFLGERRKDDFAWENEYAAYRMYGPALAPENPSNGVDLWLKHGMEPCADAMYKQEENGKPYHIDYGLGIDSYKVGHAVGCGGVALVYNDQAWVGGPFARYEILQEGPLQTIFQFEYDSILVGETILSETIKITVNAGSQVNKAEVTFNGEKIDGLKIGGGIFLHDDEQAVMSFGKQYISYCESATSDKGIYAIHEQNGLNAEELDFGQNYVTVIVPGLTSATVYDKTQLAEKSYNLGETFTYYFGGGWSKREYDSNDKWIDAVEKTAKCIENPLKIVVK